ncbi:cobalt ECF transporter T component CbiQ [Pararhizobium mangrovi]|uniref:Cobalt ECF transporter T component CbiQ n=1 Tax=Pararhizobium mangrovi TaxID=2590452 RepID=A0A506TX90_9HYPH|nr:cobalt ECF transporter T component CbiQ [Pararhizobium mangrovi]TPW26662.1 cobalt ECF transporter T component CbiQ [Pararhizobium mangrovi]
MGEQSFLAHSHGRNASYAERIVGGLAGALDHALEAETFASRRGLLQALDPRTKLACLMALAVTAVSVHSLIVLVALLAFVCVVALGSRVPLRRLWKQVGLPVFLFTGPIALPAIFLVAGPAIAHLPVLGWPISRTGLRSAAFLLLRAQTSAGLCLLLILTTPWPHVLKAMRFFRMPVVLVVILGMTHRYAFTLLETAHRMIEARQVRTLGRLSPRERRRLAGESAGVLFARALAMSTDIHQAMIARGYRGEVRLIESFRFRKRDASAFATCAVVVAGALVFGR